MRYDLSHLPLANLVSAVSDATAKIVRLDERLAGSELRSGHQARSDYADACASLWVDGELVHLEDLVLHDAGMGIRVPTHELTIARDVLRTRRRIFAHPADWALSDTGLRQLRSTTDADVKTEMPAKLETKSQLSQEEDGVDEDPLARELAKLDALIERSDALLRSHEDSQPIRAPDPQLSLVYEDDWDEDERVAEWCVVVSEVAGLPPLLQAAIVLDAWNRLDVLQHGRWLGRLLSAAVLRQSGTTGSSFAAVNVGLKQIAREKRTSRDRNTRLLSLIEAFAVGAEAGLHEHNRLRLAKQQMEMRLGRRRTSSKLPQLIEFVLSKPMVSAATIADALEISPQAALRLAGELNLRELTGRGRFRAWGIV